MSEETGIPVEPQLLDGGVKSNGSDKISPAVYHHLVKKLDDAELLLGYAAETGIDVDAKVRDAVLNARITSADKWNEQTAASVLSALTNLAAKLGPVTAKSLKICETQETFNKNIKVYKWMAIGLATLIIPISLATFITSAISKAIQADIETANKLAVILGDGIRSATKEEGTTPGQGRADILPRDLQEFAATIRAIDGRALQLDFFLFYVTADPLDRPWGGFWSKDRKKVRDRFELTPGFSDASEEAKDKIQLYQDVRYFAQSNSEAVSTIYGAIGTCILPVLYALLGACAYLLRTFEEQFKHRSYNPPDVHVARFFVAAIGGAVVGLFNNFSLSQNATIPPLAIAFLVGYATDVFFSFLESLLQTFTRRSGAGSQTQATTNT